MLIHVFRNKLGPCLVFLLLVVFGQALAEEPESPHFLPTTSTDASWVFSGVVSNEQGEQYGYFFQMERKGDKFRSHAALFDVQTKHLILQDEGEAELTKSPSNRWYVGHAFLQFNPINDSWVFGVKKADKTGFNFKVDMLKPAEALPAGQDLRPGVGVLVSQAHSLNGHIYTPNGAKEEFVTAKHAWFRQMAVTEKRADSPPVKGILCRFSDDSGFYSVNLPAADAIRGAMTGRFDAEGIPAPMSQFVHVEALSDEKWTIRVPSPNQKVTVSHFLKASQVVAGIAEVEGRVGFCVLSEDTVGTEDDKKQTV